MDTPELPTPASPQTLSYNPNAPVDYQNQASYDYYTPQPSQEGGTVSHSFWEIWKTVWIQVDVSAYQSLLPGAKRDISNPIVWVVVASWLQLVVGLLLASVIEIENFNTLNTGIEISESLGPNAGFSMLVMMVIIVGIAPILALLHAAIFFITPAGISHVVARVLGGKGKYWQTALLYSAAHAPLLLIATLRVFTPIHIALQYIGYVIAAGLIAYELRIRAFAIKAVHNLNWAKSIVVVLAPYLILLGLVLLGIRTLSINL